MSGCKEERSTQVKIQISRTLLKGEIVNIPRPSWVWVLVFQGICLFYTYKCFIYMYVCVLPACLVPVEVRRGHQIPLSLKL